MSSLRNPFRMRASERIESEATFLRLFSPIVLEALKEKNDKDSLWNTVLFLQSSPGGGKTSLLRLFSPNSLKSLYKFRTSPNYKDLYNFLKHLNVINEGGIKVLGIFTSCAKNYSILEDLPIDELSKQHLFFSLLNARLIISTLREIVNLKNIDFPNGLENILFQNTSENRQITGCPTRCTGKNLYEWAMKIEEGVYNAIISIKHNQDNSGIIFDNLFFLDILKPNNFRFNNKPLEFNFLFMFDDLHKLTDKQRYKFKELLIEKRELASVWIAERLEALSNNELLPTGATIGRDYNKIRIEEYWDRYNNKFKNIVTDISNKRVKIVDELQINTFDECLAEDIDESSYETDFLKLKETLIKKLENISKATQKYQEWVDYGKDFEGTLLEQAIKLQQIEILIERSRYKNQLSFDFPYQTDDSFFKEISNLKTTAEFFISKKYNLPYYFGLNNLAKISSQNIEQYLAFSADLFDEVISRHITKEAITITAPNQEKIIRKVCKDKWNELSKVTPYGKMVIKFLTFFGKMAEEETDKSNAPYAPGVTGLGIKINKTESIFNDEIWIDNKEYKDLLNVLSSCIAFNLLKINDDINQGQKGDKWMVFYLNRWLCVYFGLPLHYGGWRPKKPQELLNWIK